MKLTPSTLLEVAIESVPVRRILEPQFLYGVDRAKAGTMVQDRPTRPFVYIIIKGIVSVLDMNDRRGFFKEKCSCRIYCLKTKQIFKFPPGKKVGKNVQ